MPKVKHFVPRLGRPSDDEFVYVTMTVRLRRSTVMHWMTGAKIRRVVTDPGKKTETEWERVPKAPRKHYPADARYNAKRRLEEPAARAAASAAKAENIEAAQMDVSGMTQEQLEAVAAGVRVRAHGGPIEAPNPKKPKAALVPLPKDWSE